MTNYPRNFSDQVWSWVAGWVAIAAISLVIPSIVADMKGYQENDHLGPMPAGVVQITSDAYIIEGESRATPDDICKGSDTSGNDPVEESSKIPAMDNAFYVQCYKEQTWNVTGTPSKNFGEAMGEVATSPKWFVPVGALGLIFAIAPLSTVFRVSRGRAAAKNREMANREHARRELRISYAHGEINDLELIQGLDRLYDGKIPKEVKRD